MVWTFDMYDFVFLSSNRTKWTSIHLHMKRIKKKKNVQRRLFYLKKEEKWSDTVSSTRVLPSSNKTKWASIHRYAKWIKERQSPRDESRIDCRWCLHDRLLCQHTGIAFFPGTVACTRWTVVALSIIRRWPLINRFPPIMEAAIRGSWQTTTPRTVVRGIKGGGHNNAGLFQSLRRKPVIMIGWLSRPDLRVGPRRSLNRHTCSMKQWTLLALSGLLWITVDSPLSLSLSLSLSLFLNRAVHSYIRWNGWMLESISVVLMVRYDH